MSEHTSVLLTQSIEGLNLRANGIIVDGTFGRGGHSEAILQHIPQGRLLAFDKDTAAIEAGKKRLAAYQDQVTFIHSDFKNIKEQCLLHNVNQIDGFLLDLGVSSPQLDEESRGFSYRFDSRLDMRMDQTQSLDAWQVVNTYSEERLSKLLWQYGEEPFAKAIAKKIAAVRQQYPIDTTGQLVEVIKSVLPQKVLNKKGHPAKQSFQAIRIEVNHELESLEEGLKAAMEMLAPQGRIAVITFHSLEDRIVKECFNEVTKPIKVDKRLPILAKDLPQPEFLAITKKPILPDSEEQLNNPRAHSAKLRIIEKK